MSRTFVLAVATVLVALGSLLVFSRDLSHDPRGRVRTAVEAALPLVGVGALLWWAWAVL